MYTSARDTIPAKRKFILYESLRTLVYKVLHLRRFLRLQGQTTWWLLSWFLLWIEWLWKQPLITHSFSVVWRLSRTRWPWCLLLAAQQTVCSIFWRWLTSKWNADSKLSLAQLGGTQTSAHFLFVFWLAWKSFACFLKKVLSTGTVWVDETYFELPHVLPNLTLSECIIVPQQVCPSAPRS